MTRTSFAAVALFSLPLLSGAALAGTDVPLPPFSAVDLHGGGNAIIQHGAVQRVTIIKGDLKNSGVEVRNGTLDIEGCKRFWKCPWGYQLEVEIVTPGVKEMEIHGGGDLVAKGSFPVQDVLNVHVHGGGDADVRVIPVKKMDAHVHGGGDLHVNVIESLTAEVHGGGDITYKGHPRVVSNVHGGGSIDGE